MTMSGKKCFLIGHREASEEIYSALYTAIETHIVYCNVREFVVGHYGNFDRLAARAVKAAKRWYPDVKLTLLLPYYPTTHKEFLSDGFDSTLYPSGMEDVPKKAAIIRANRYMIEHADYLIIYAHHSASNAVKLLAYARKREKKGLIQITEIPFVIFEKR